MTRLACSVHSTSGDRMEPGPTFFREKSRTLNFLPMAMIVAPG